MRQQSPSGWAVICVLIAAVVHLALGFSIEFSVDEAHYALYAQHLAWSYFDHPPLVGWIQWPLVALTSSEGIIRLIPELLWILSCYLVYEVTVEVHHFIRGRNAGYLTSALPSANLCGLMAVLTVIAAPMLHILAIGLLPDTLLAPLSLGLMWMALRWLSKDQFSIGDWIIAGILLGVAGLSKYTAAFTALALLLVFLSTPRKPWITKVGFWIAALIALLLITPVLYWNWANDWISFKYQLAHGGGGEWLWRRLGTYIGIQILVFGHLTVGNVVSLHVGLHVSFQGAECGNIVEGDIALSLGLLIEQSRGVTHAASAATATAPLIAAGLIAAGELGLTFAWADEDHSDQPQKQNAHFLHGSCTLGKAGSRRVSRLRHLTKVCKVSLRLHPHRL